MFERLHTPEEAYNFKLGAALKMERTVLEMLEKLQDEAEAEQVKQQFQHHHQETQQHIANLEKVTTSLQMSALLPLPFDKRLL